MSSQLKRLVLDATRGLSASTKGIAMPLAPTTRPPLLWRGLSRSIEHQHLDHELAITGPRDRYLAGGRRPASARVEALVTDPALPLRIALGGSFEVAEAYMDGRLAVRRGTLREFLLLGARLMRDRDSGRVARFAQRLWRTAMPANTRRRSARNARAHYDLPAAFYRLFLDRRMQYSCAYFVTGTESIEVAQEYKIARIGAKLRLEPGLSLLDIGCGWGTLAIALAELGGVRATGITLAPEQVAEARRLAAQSVASGRICFEEADYRDVAASFDRVVSVGMLEHVGRAKLRSFFADVAARLRPDGVAVIHSIGRFDANTGPDSFTDRYIFPGGHIPSLSEVIPAVEASGLLLTDLEILCGHYASTLEQWSHRFAANRRAAVEMVGERFCRMWEFYLAAAETGFRDGKLMVFQLQLTHRRDAVPETRRYLISSEAKLLDRLRCRLGS